MVVDALKNVSASHRSPQDMENHYECLGTGAVHIALTAPPGCGRGRPLASVTVTIDAPDCCPWRGFIVESTCVVTASMTHSYRNILNTGKVIL
ncbi:hypothetical protein RRG08_063775 [Elysia crispata]|uniref:Uncharacterized protein n=1 Tax=Elysia crispata TaxID=231223 RepID=A0AAE1DZU4_9GAST|nr:hypothetical protein RRG08_063775 [Elysia crispata]